MLQGVSIFVQPILRARTSARASKIDVVFLAVSAAAVHIHVARVVNPQNPGAGEQHAAGDHQEGGWHQEEHEEDPPRLLDVEPCHHELGVSRRIVARVPTFSQNSILSV